MVFFILDKSIKIWNITSSNLEKSLNDHKEAAKCLVELKNNKFASGSEDMTIKIWDLSYNSSSIGTLIGHSGVIPALVELENGHLASAALDSLSFIRANTGFKLVRTLESTDSACHIEEWRISKWVEKRLHSNMESN
jgi:WD40 repeat protein